MRKVIISNNQHFNKMKKIKFLALMSAIALTSAVGFTACSSSDEATADVNPTIDGESVKTQFTISFPQNVAAGTRQSAATVQNAQNIASFRGMDNIKLIPFGVNTTVTATDERIGKPIELKQQIVGKASATYSTTSPHIVTNYIDAGDLMNNSNSVLYQDVEIPVGTGAFLFYGKAIDNTANESLTTIADKFKFGMLTPSNELTSSKTGVPTDITFTPVAIQETVSGLKGGTADNIVDYLNAIAGATGWSTETSNAAIQQLYTRFITMKAGSSQAVSYLLGDLLWSIRNNTSGVADAIRAKIFDGGTLNTSTGAITGTNHNYIASAALDDSTNPTTYIVTLGDACGDYPANQNLPEGAAQIAWNGTNNAFEVISTNVPTATSASMNVAALTSYVYPANLSYYVNSPAMVASTSQKDRYDGAAGHDWAFVLAGYTQGYVGASTRSVAIKAPIQYGVGQLKMQAKTAAATLKDNSDQLDIPTADVTVDAAGFPIKGILIGGQRAVDWEFLPQTSTALYTIYDNIESTNAIKAGKADFGGWNYTLALETPVQEHVYIALELVNNTGVDFYGQSNQVIKAGSTFYLVGELDPTTNTTVKYAAAHKAYWANGNVATKAATDNIDQVFVQDYVTELNLNIANLRNALNTIPDLRMPNMEFGLSVDLSWKPGISFNVDL